MISTHGMESAFPATAAADPGQAERPRDTKEAAQAFEALFLEQLLSTMRATVQDGGLFKKGFAEKTFQEMLDRTYAGIMSRRGSVGLAGILHRSWGAEGAEATEPAAAGATKRACAGYARHLPAEGEGR